MHFIKCTNVGMIPNLIEFYNQNKSVLNDVSSFFENNKYNVYETDKSSGLHFEGTSCESCRNFSKERLCFKIKYKCFFLLTNALLIK